MCVVSSQYFASGSQIWSLRLLNSQTEPRKKEWNWKFLPKLFSFEFWRAFILLYCLYIPFVLLLAKFQCKVERKKQRSCLECGFAFLKYLLESQPPLCLLGVAFLCCPMISVSVEDSDRLHPNHLAVPKAGEKGIWCWGSFWEQCPNNATPALSLAAQGPSVILGLIGPCISTRCSVLHMPMISVLKWIWAVSVKLSVKWVCGLNVLTVLIWDVTCSWNACLLTYHLFVCNEQPESPKPVKHQASGFF